MKINYFLFLLCLISWSTSCNNKKSESQVQEKEVDVRTPVTVTKITFEPLEDFIELNASSTYLQKITVKATTQGYIKSSSVKFASPVSAGQTIFSIKTKESESIGNTINKLDPSFHFNGINYIKTPASGYVTELNHQVGDYVQDGEQLAVISDSRSFVFILDMPYEYRQLVMGQKTVILTLPDGERLQGGCTIRHACS